MLGRRSAVIVAWLVVAVVSFGGWALAAETAPPAAPPATPGTGSEQGKRAAAIPADAWKVLAEIQSRRGAPPPGYVGGRTFQNREGRLPRGTYREYDVHPKVAGRPRDAARLVIEQKTGRAYYSADHYRTFHLMLR